MTHPNRLLVGVLLITVGVFWSVCGHEFIAYDDEINIYANRYVTTFSLANVGHFWTGLHQNLYIPVTYSLWMVLAQIGSFFSISASQLLSPVPFHVVNLLLHLSCTALVFLIIKELVDDEWGAAGAALLFAVHPLQVEAVAWATGMKDVLSGGLGLLAVWQYLASVKKATDPARRLRHSLLAGIAFAGALLAKPGAVTLPLALAMLAYLLLSRSPRVLAREFIPWFLAALPVLLITKMAQPVFGQNLYLSIWQRLLIAGDAWTFYLLKFLCPWQLGPDYGRTPQMVLGSGGGIWLSGLASYLLIGLGLWRGNRYCQAALAISLAMVLPVSGLVSFDFQEYSTVADRYFYLAMLGPALLLGWLVARFRSRKWLLVSVAVILGVCGIRSLLQVRHWQNGDTFYQNALEVNPRSWFAANNLGVINLDRKEYAEATRLLELAISWKPDYAIALNNLGAVNGAQGRLLTAQGYFARALEINPKYADAAANLGDMYLRRGDVGRAREYYSRALEAKPDFADVHLALGEIANSERHFPEAMEHYQRAREYGLATVKLFNNLGLVYKEMGRIEEALACYRQALSVAPNSAEVHNNLGLINFETGRYTEAISQFEQAARLSPNQPQPYANLGKALLASRQLEAARDAFTKALAVDRGYAPALSGLAKYYRAVGREDLAADYTGRARALGFAGD